MQIKADDSFPALVVPTLSTLNGSARGNILHIVARFCTEMLQIMFEETTKRKCQLLDKSEP